MNKKKVKKLKKLLKKFKTLTLVPKSHTDDLLFYINEYLGKNKIDRRLDYIQKLRERKKEVESLLTKLDEKVSDNSVG